MFHSSRPRPPLSASPPVAEGLSGMNGKPHADGNREGGIKAERRAGTEISCCAIGADGGGRVQSGLEALET